MVGKKIDRKVSKDILEWLQNFSHKYLIVIVSWNFIDVEKNKTNIEQSKKNIKNIFYQLFCKKSIYPNDIKYYEGVERPLRRNGKICDNCQFEQSIWSIWTDMVCSKG